MKFQASSFFKKSFLLLSVAVPSSTSFWAASRLQTRNANTSDGRDKMEALLTKLQKVEAELEILKSKPQNLETKISGYKTEYKKMTSASEINTEIDKQFSDGENKMKEFVKKFIDAKKESMIYKGESTQK